MAHQRQFSLFDSRPLFEPETLSRARAEWAQRPIADYEAKSQRSLEFFLQTERVISSRKRANEEALEQEFNSAFFCQFLGYQLYPGNAGGWTAWPKPPSDATRLSGTPDLLLGHFDHDLFKPTVVVELKKPKVNLDAPQAGYGGKTPVEQAFEYARKLGDCRWVCVSNMRFIRLYSIESLRNFHEIDLWSVDSRIAMNEAWFILAFESLVDCENDSRTWRLLQTSQNNQTAFQEGFYQIYSEIRDDLISELMILKPDEDRLKIVGAAQRLLDRLMFIYFCEDHPDRLLKQNILKEVVDNAVRQPGNSEIKAYQALLSLFRDLDVGAETQFWRVPKYNGELFKIHPILDSVTLPDRLHGKKYTWTSSNGSLRRTVDGAYGLHIFDFWKELDKDLLGNVFERSIGDLTAISEGGRPDARQAFGIYYTASRLAQYAANSAVEAMLLENDSLQKLLVQISEAGDSALIDAVFDQISEYRIADIACGSGVFLTAAFEALLVPFRKSVEASTAGALEIEASASKQAEILKGSIYGCDLLPQAVELAKLSLWLSAARQNEPSADLSANFVTGDALAPAGAANLAELAGGTFDLIVGNPPWGADVERPQPAMEGLDSWEVFLRISANLLKPGGRLCLILPDTIFMSNKADTRRWLVENFQIEKLFSLGPDWFTNQVRMGSVMLQARKSQTRDQAIKTLVLAGDERVRAQKGLRPISQAEEIGGSTLSQARIMEQTNVPFSVLRGDDEEELFNVISANSKLLSAVTKHARGDEMSAKGFFWKCGNCGILVVPGAKKKGGGYRNKQCPNCGATLSVTTAEPQFIVSETRHSPADVTFIDGDALTRRYQNPVRKFVRTDLKVAPAQKPSDFYEGRKILIRQAGVGLVATLIEDSSRVPQSIYLYWISENAHAEGYSEEFILACLCSRVLNFYHMKTSGEIDPARAFAKVTHSVLGQLPIPILDTVAKRKDARTLSKLSRQMLCLPQYGGELDLKIELMVQKLYGLSGDQGRYINGFFSIVPDGQARRDLFPSGPPSRIPYSSCSPKF